MNTQFLEILTCPVCKKSFEISGNSLLCTNDAKRHCFDMARSGHVNLLCSHGGSGDDKTCADSRTSFLEKDFYRPFSDEINALLKKYGVKNLLDAGCGEGYYTHRAAEVCETALGIDLSKFAIETAAKRAKREGKGNELYAVAGIFDIPAANDSFDGIINLFAPCCEEEFARILTNGGILILGAAGKDHLLGLKQAIYETTYQNESRGDLPCQMELLEKKTVSFEITLECQSDIQNLFAMTPYFYRTSLSDKEKLGRLNRLKTGVEFDIFVYKSSKGGGDA